ncbi:heterokaryon incompatibility protein-domain-containing protein [Annulohypoxylon moriforme]|nr:heterokaryon incompatibility protein-domain-containing protein [Annulohypoxylon moriforme]
MEGYCNICHAIWVALASTEVTDNIHLGALSEALSSPCSIHTPLIQRFKEVCRQGWVNMTDDVMATCDVSIVPRSKDRSASISLFLSKVGYVSRLLLINRVFAPDHPGNGRILDPDWSDVDLLPRWKHECLTKHGARCENPFKIWKIRPAWLIDVKRKCLVPGQESDGPYVALSYRYGDHPSLELNAAIVAKLRERDALDTPQMSPFLSPVVRHAMYVTSVLGERYLWADSLCITHFDRASTTAQLQLMGVIYGNAIVTIIAIDTDSDEGLPGLKGVSGSRKLEQDVIPLGEERVLMRYAPRFSMTHGASYHDRGWTYQEFLNSGRKVLFINKELHWECSCSMWHEDTTFGEEIDQYINPRIHTILAGFPDMGSMNDIITEYNRKELRYDEDALPAISGLLSITSRSFTGGFLYGLPQMFFDRALGWRPCWKQVNLRRRVASERSFDSKLNPSQLPSWSWIGWQGLLTGGYGEAARINNRQNYIEETFPITEWYTAGSPTAAASERRRIRSTWFTDRESYKDFSKPLPPGWTRHDTSTQAPFRGDPFLYPDGCGEYIFKHEAMTDPDTETNAWYYPFPVANISESTPPVHVEQTEYLFCETQRARLWARRLESDDPYQGMNVLQLVDAEETPVGVLHCHNQEQAAGFPEVVEDDEAHGEMPLGKQVELVAIYRSKVYLKIRDEEMKVKGIKASERIAVLWVEWLDGVAYRLASGHVGKEAWSKLPLEDISLTLG